MVQTAIRKSAAASRNAQLVATTVNDPRWVSVVARDPKADGTFYYSVRTTGVYCRPSCASRLAKPENVRFHGSQQEARQAGFRPCKRCKPDQSSVPEQNSDRIMAACRMIEQKIDAGERVPVLEGLAARMGLSAFHFHRLFKRITGLTPREYAAGCRERRLRAELGRGARVTEAIAGAGYASGSRFYEQAGAVLGMQPKRYRAGGVLEDIRFAIGECSLGAILVAQSGSGVCAILLGNDPDGLLKELQDSFPRANLIGGDTDFEKLMARVVGFIEAPRIGLDLPLDIRGTLFQRRVWQALRKIPPGSTASYTQIARRIGLPKSVRAVAGACAANTLAVAIPCHRVVRNDGALSGYRWGIERKRALLDKESDSE